MTTEELRRDIIIAAQGNLDKANYMYDWVMLFKHAEYEKSMKDMEDFKMNLLKWLQVHASEIGYRAQDTLKNIIGLNL